MGIHCTVLPVFGGASNSNSDCSVDGIRVAVPRDSLCNLGTGGAIYHEAKSK